MRVKRKRQRIRREIAQKKYSSVYGLVDKLRGRNSGT